MPDSDEPPVPPLDAATAEWRDSGREVWFLNRNLAVLRARAPVVTWLRRRWPEGPELSLASLKERPAALLIPPFEHVEDAWSWCRDNAPAFVHVALQNWFVPPELWPEDPDWDLVARWFHVELVECLWDLVDEELTSDPDGGVDILEGLEDDDFAEA